VAFSDHVPNYRLSLNVTTNTTGWMLGVSALTGGTVLHTATSTTAGLTVVPYLLSATMSRGRTDELGSIQAGTATFVVSNSDGRYSPLNAASPYYPNLVPRRQIALEAQFGTGPWYPLWYGYVESYKPVDVGAVDSNVTITCADWLSKAATCYLNAARPAETDQARFQWICSIVGTDTLTPVVIGPAANTEMMEPITYANVAASQALQDLTTATRGVIYVDRTGVPTYRTRFGKFSARGNFYNSGYVFDQFGVHNTANVVPYLQPLDYDMTLLNLYNDIQVTGYDNIMQEAQDSASQTRYGLFTLSLSLPQLDPARSLTLAQWLLSLYKTPAVKVHSITVDGDAWLANNTVAPWNILFQLELGDTVQVLKTQPASASLNKLLFVEKVTHTIAADLAGHQVALQLSDTAQAGTPPWILGTSTLATSTIFAY
jgi:hypothetical protein